MEKHKQTFATSDRKLENFLYAHMFVPIRTYKSKENPQFGFTVWEFEASPRLFAVVDEYRDLMREK